MVDSGADGLAREGNLDILTSWHQLGSLAAVLAPAWLLSCFALQPYWRYLGILAPRWGGIPAILVPWCENHRFWDRKYRHFGTIGTTKTEVWYCKYWVIALEGHLGIWVAKWSILGGPCGPEARVRGWMASRAKEILIS